MNDVINGVPRELLEQIETIVRGYNDRSPVLKPIRALLSEQPQAKPDKWDEAMEQARQLNGVALSQASAAQSAPAGEREAFEAWYLRDSGFTRSALTRNGHGFYINEDAQFSWEGWQAGAAWQRTQSAGVPEGWRVERRELDGSVCFIIGSPRIAGVRSNTSVWESDSDPAHLLLWHMLAAAPAQPAAHDQGEVRRLREALASAEKNERHRNNSETRYWCDQYKQLARAILAASTGQEV